MSIERKKQWQLGAVVAVIAGWTAWIAAVPGPGTGRSFTPASLASPFTQDLYATTGNLPSGSILGGVAFAPDGRVWSAECTFLGTRLHRFSNATTSTNGSSVHEEELVVDLTASGPGGHDIGGCGLVNHPDGFLYSSSTAGIWKLNATTGAYVAGPFGHGSNALGIAVDPDPLGGHHLVYVGDDCHPSLNFGGTTCTLWDWDPATPAAPSQVFARLSTPETSDVLIDGLYFDPSGQFLFAAHREQQVDGLGHITKLNSLEIIRRQALQPDTPDPAPMSDSQIVRRIAMVSEPDGVAFHAVEGFVVTLNESLDCVNTLAPHNVVASDPNTGSCPATATPIGGTMTRFDFASADYTQVPTVSTFATGGFRGDLLQVGADGCIYATQAPFGAITGLGDISAGSSIVTHLSTSGLSAGQLVSGPGIPAGTRIVSVDSGVQITVTHSATATSTGVLLTFGAGTRYDDMVETGDDSIVQICGGFVPPPGVLTPTLNETSQGSIGGLVFLDANHNGVRDSGEGGLAGVTLTLSTDPASQTISTATGTFVFEHLDAGTYTVTAPATATYLGGSIVLSTAGSSGTIILAVGEHKTDLEFGYAPGTIAGTVFIDANHNQVLDGGEAGLPGVTVSLTGTSSSGMAISSSDGTYKFTLLTSDDYTVTVPSTAGALVLTTVGSRSFTLAAGEDKTGVDFGYAPPIGLSCVLTGTGQVGVAYNSSLVVTGGLGPYTYSIVGALPEGLTLNATTGAISGTPTTAGTYTFTATVVDATGTAAGTTTSDCTSITIAPAPLTISCVSPATGQVGVAYSGSAVASGGVAPYTYAIVGTLPAGLTLNAATGAISGTPTAAGSFTVKVTDANGAGASTATSQCSITIAPAPPALSCVAVTTGQVGVAYSSSLVATGGVGPYTYSIIAGSLPAGLTLDASTGAITGTPTTAGAPSFTAQVVDARGTAAGTTTNSCGITIAPAPPALSCVAATTGQVGVAYSSSLVATGGVGPYTYSIIAGSLPAGLTLDASTGAITGTPTTAGAPSFTAQVVDARGTAAGTTTNSCGITIAPAPPALSCVAVTTGQVGVAYSSSLVATGGVGPYTYSIIAGSLPAGLTLNASTGAITGTPTTAGAPSFTAQVVDARGTAAGTTTNSCGITIAPAPPALSCVAATTGQVGVAYSSSLVATGGVGPYTYSIIAGSLPAGLTLNASTGAITGTPTTAGAPSFTAQVVDARGTAAGTTTNSCGITIAPAPLTISCVSPATGQVGVAYSGSAVASGGVAPYTYAIVGTLPAGLTLDAATGAISGTPTAAGSFTVKVTDANGAGASTATSQCSITIAPAPPALSCVAATTGQVGVAYSSSLVATGGVGPYTYSIIAGSLPAGLTLNASTGAITGTPTTAGAPSFTAQVVDARGTAAGTTTNSCGITIAPAPLTISCVSPATGQVGVAYSGSAVASGGVAPYTYAIVGTLPAGLTLNAATGAISGTPTAAGSFTVKVTDANGAGASTATSQCSITIAPAPPALSCVAATTGQVGVAYSSSLVATGGVGPYTYSIIAGSLPAGLTLNASTGAITGTPTTAGAPSFTAQVVDARGTAAGTTTNSCGITIAPAPPALSCVAATTGQVGVAYSSSLVATGGVGPYTYSIIAGSLPAGLTLNASTGAITGTPTTAGPFAFTAKVVDSRNNAAGTTTSSSCGITIAPAPPALSCVAATTGQVGVAYSSSLVATGGIGPYTYSIITGSLPLGLTLNASTGAITGTPTTAGPFAFTAKVVDSRNNAAGTTTSSGCGITIAPGVVQSPGLSITKSANTTTYTSIGQVIVYTYVVKNTGNVILAGPFTVTDDKLGVLPCTTATSLSPGASITCTASYVIKASDLGSVISLPSGVVANVDTGAWLGGVLSTQDTTISGAGPGVPNGIYPGWCIQDHVPTDLHNQPATLYSTIGGNLPADMVGRHWNQINYLLNHKIRAAGISNLGFFKDVQTAVWVLNGELNPEFGISATAQQMINEANAHPTFVPGPSDVVAVIVYSDGIAGQIRTGEIQESIIEMEPRASITNLALVTGKFGTVTVTSNQAQATVTQVIAVLAPDVVSLTQSAASAMIASTGLTVGTVTSAPSSIVPSGGVASQTPAAGVSVLSGTSVALVISSGAPAVGPAVDKMLFSDGTGKRTTAAFSTASAGEVLIALATSDGPSSGGQTLTVAGAGLTWTLVRRANAQLGSAEIWKATAGSALTNVTVSSTQSAGGYHQSLSVVTFTRATGVGASAAASAATGAPTVSLTTTKANSLVFGTGNDWDKALARTVGSNQQMIHQWMDIGTGDTHWVQAGKALVSTVGTVFQLNDTAPTADHWNLVAVEIVP